MSLDAEPLRGKIESVESNNIVPSKPMDESVGKPLNIQKEKLNVC